MILNINDEGVLEKVVNEEDKSIIIPDNVKVIGMYAFQRNTATEIIVPDSVVRIEYGAFSDCPLLERIILPNGIKSIPSRAFYRCNHLREIDLPDSVEEIKDGAFMACFNLRRIRLSNNLKVIGRYVFSSCNGLIEIEIPESVTSIGVGAFDDCIHLKELILPMGITEITLQKDEKESTAYKHTFPPYYSLSKTIRSSIRKIVANIPVNKFPKELKGLAAIGYCEKSSNGTVFSSEVVASYDKYFKTIAKKILAEELEGISVVTISYMVDNSYFKQADIATVKSLIQTLEKSSEKLIDEKEKQVLIELMEILDR